MVEVDMSRTPLTLVTEEHLIAAPVESLIAHTIFRPWLSLLIIVILVDVYQAKSSKVNVVPPLVEEAARPEKPPLPNDVSVSVRAVPPFIHDVSVVSEI